MNLSGGEAAELGGERDHPFLGPAPTLQDLRRSEARMVVARLVAAPWIFAQVFLYSTFPYPDRVKEAALALASAFLAGNVVVWLFSRGTATYRAARLLALASLSFDVLVASAFVWLFAFDQISALWAVLLIVPLEGALRFGLRGALGSWVAVAILYAAREIWGSGRYDYPFLIDSVSFRMGIGLLIALVAGFMSRDLLRQRLRLAAALEQVRRVDAVRSALVSTLAHDVRNPLAAIRGSLQTLIRRGAGIPPDKASALLAMADRQARRLERLSIDLLDLARMERGTLPLEVTEVELRPAVDSALSYVDGGAGVEVRVPPGLSVRADPARLEQVIVNLAANAIRYGDPPFVVEASRDDSWVTLEFMDSGPGVPADRLSSLFEPVQASSERGSIGLGLAIVRGLVEAHGGRIRYRSNRPRGACFQVDLPAGSSGGTDGST